MFNFTGKLLSLTAATLMVSTAISSAQSMDELVAAAKAEGQLTTIALPHDWCGYGAVIDGFKAKYPEITINELNPDAGSGDEVEAIKANKDNKGPQAPDVIDVGLSFGPVRQGRWPADALQGVDLGLDPGFGQGRGRLLDRRLLRRAGVRSEQGPRQERAGRLGRPAQGRIQEHRRAGRRSAHLEPGRPGRLCRRPVEGRCGR